MDVWVTGVGHTQFGALEDSLRDLMREASEQAIADAELSIDDISCAYIANFSDGFTGQCHLPAVLASALGRSMEATRVESACASGALALKQAAIAVASGLYDNVLVVGVEKMSSTSTKRSTELLAGAAAEVERNAGATFPSLFALMAQAHFAEFGSSEMQLAAIAEKNHKNAYNNPLAHFRKLVSRDDVMASRSIAAPLKLLDCSPMSDGAAAVVVSAKPTGDSSVRLAAIGHSATPIEMFSREHLWSLPAVAEAGRKAFELAGMTHRDINVAELHDCFTVAEMVQSEELGFFPPGEGGVAAEEGRTAIDGDVPINTSGGLKAKGHPVGATGVSQVVEIVKQLRGHCEDRQTTSPETGLCCNIGGSGSSAIVSILTRWSS